MKYTPRILKDNVNVSRTSAGKEFFVLLGGILLILVFIYIILGFAIDIVVTRLPEDVQQSIESSFSRFYQGYYRNEIAESKLQELLDELTKYLPGHEREYIVHLVEDSRENAIALPGGHIIVFTGLLKYIESENELSMILAHELGHFSNKDHLRALGRGLVLLVISAAVLGSDNPATVFLRNSLVNVEMKFSQAQEKAADLFALELLNKRYGHVSGATDFFERLSKERKMNHFLFFFATHPVYRDRIYFIKEQIVLSGYKEKEKTPLDEVFKRLNISSEKEEK